jgi:heme-degrading monooxygenase HmoA
MAASIGFERVWRFRVRAGCERRFEDLYGSEGAWARLFARHAGFRGTELQCAEDARSEYMLVDRWQSRADWDAFRRQHAAAYDELDRHCEALTISEDLIREIDHGAP